LCKVSLNQGAIGKFSALHFTLKKYGVIEYASLEVNPKSKLTALTEMNAGKLTVPKTYVLHTGIMRHYQGQVAAFESAINKYHIIKTGMAKVAVFECTMLESIAIQRCYFLKNLVFLSLHLVKLGIMYMDAKSAKEVAKGAKTLYAISKEVLSPFFAFVAFS
jgi:hypothetical protein